VRITSAGPAAGDPVAVYLTTGDLTKKLQRQPDRRFSSGSGSGAVIRVDPALTGQRLTTGFGIAMTDTSAWLLARKLPVEKRNRVMQRLFSRVNGGIGLSFLRIPIGGSDYIVNDPYSYDDQRPGRPDPDLSDFSIAHDKAYILPMIRKALRLNPRMRVMANAWTPPAWMKTDDKLVTTTGPLGTLRPEYYGTYSRYLVKFLKAYERNGVAIDYLGIQNEPLTPLLLVAGIPESYLGPLEAAILVNDHVAPDLATSGLAQKPRLMAYDDGYSRSEAYVPPYMFLARKNTGGIAYHCYMSDPKSVAIESQLYPEMLQLETECSSKLSNIDPEQMAIRSLRNGVQGVQLWNAALDQKGGPKIGNGCAGLPGTTYAGQDCIAPVRVNTTTGTYRMTSDFWALAQFSRFIRLGAVRVESTNSAFCPTTPLTGHHCGLENVVFRNRDGSYVLVATAHDGKAHKLSVAVGDRHFNFTLPDRGVATFTWRA
jgi:glucosylceramidase